MLTIIGGYKFNFRGTKWYEKFRESTFFSFISWMPFMVSDQVELSFRYRYMGFSSHDGDFPYVVFRAFRVWVLTRGP